MDRGNGCAPGLPHCGGFIKTATVSFGQSMPEEPMRRAQELAESCDLFIAIGSSLVVWPAAGFPLARQAQRRAARHRQPRRRPSSTTSPISLSGTTSATCSRRSSRTDSLDFQGLFTTPHISIARIWRSGCNVALVKADFVEASNKRRLKQRNQRHHGVGRNSKGPGARTATWAMKLPMMRQRPSSNSPASSNGLMSRRVTASSCRTTGCRTFSCT